MLTRPYSADCMTLHGCTVVIIDRWGRGTVLPGPTPDARDGIDGGAVSHVLPKTETAAAADRAAEQSSSSNSSTRAAEQAERGVVTPPFSQNPLTGSALKLCFAALASYYSPRKTKDIDIFITPVLKKDVISIVIGLGRGFSIRRLLAVQVAPTHTFSSSSRRWTTTYSTTY